MERRSERPPFLGTGPTIGRKIKGLTGSVPNLGVRENPSATADDYSGSAIRTVVPSPILLDIVIFPPSSAVRRSIPESP